MKAGGKFIDWATTLAAIVMILITALLSPYCLRASAETDKEKDLVTEYEDTNVWDNLKGSTIAGNAFDPVNYPHTEKDKPRILSFVEFCYSLYSDNQDDYGLYIYLYNPQDLVIDTETSRNQIQIRCGKGSYEKYSLIFLNYSKETGYEGRFWKFKLNLTETQKQNILKDLDGSGRTYEVSGITLSVKKEAAEYACGQKYTYKGYVKGYGSALAESDTLSCTVDGFENYIELNVKQTCYRPQGDYYNGEQAQLNSCYFRVPEKYFTDYGALSKIVCEWWEYITKPILVTETDYLYQNLYNLHGANISNFNPSMRFLIMALAFLDKESWFNKAGYLASFSSNIEQFDDSYSCWEGLAYNKFPEAGKFFGDPTRKIDNFAAVFYAGDSYADRYVSAEELKAQLLLNSEILGGCDITERYDSRLFAESVTEGHTRGYNKKTIARTDKQDIFWNKTTKDTWQTIFGGYNLETKYDSLDAIIEVNAEDLSGSDAEIATRLCVGDSEVASIKEEFNKCSDERLILFRYGASKYLSFQCTESYSAANVEEVDDVLVNDHQRKIRANEMTAYLSQETVYLDFDIISLWFTAEDGAETEIPVVMSPQDVFSALDPPLDINFHNGKSKLILAVIIALLVIVLLVVLLYYTGLLPAVAKGIAWLVCAPFKGIAALSRKAKENRERKRSKASAGSAGVKLKELNGGQKAQYIRITEINYAAQKRPKRAGAGKGSTTQGKGKYPTVKSQAGKKSSNKGRRKL